MEISIEDRVRKHLMGKFPSNMYAIWDILGEDPNCDMGGHHSEPLLARVECDYNKAVEYAMSLGEFIIWGSGGRICPSAKVHKIDKDSINKRKLLLEEKAKLLTRLKEIEGEL